MKALIDADAVKEQVISSLQGEVTTLQNQVSALQGQMASQLETMIAKMNEYAIRGKRLNNNAS